MMNRLLEQVQNTLTDNKNITIISLDIFDTLLFRTVKKPDSVFEIIGKKAISRGILENHMDPMTYKYIRIEGEKRARNKKLQLSGTEEVELSDIMACLPVDKQTADVLHALELETEQELCYLNPDIPELFRYLQNHPEYKVILVSDMYLSKKQIIGLLTASGIETDWFTDIFISSELQKNKKEGEIYRFITDHYKCHPEEILHIGDNYMSDVVNAKFCGLYAIYYDVISSDKYMDLQMEQLKYGSLSPELYALRCYVSRQADGFDPEHRAWFEIGARIFAPLLTGFAEWVLDEAEQEEITHIFPLMREGYIISLFLEQAARYRNSSFHIEPLYVSRKALFVPGLHIWDEEAVDKLAEIKLGTIGSVMEMFELEGECFREYWDAPLDSLGQIEINGQAMEECLKTYLLSPEQADHIQKKIDKERQNLQSYLNSAGADQNFITVDLGMKGTMQKNLSELCSSEKKIHLLAFGAYETLFKIMDGVDIRGYVGCAGSGEDLVLDVVQRPYIWEQFLMCREGTTVGYTDEGMPVTQLVPGMTEEQFQWIEWCQEGMLAFQSEFLKLKERKHISISPQDATKMVQRLVTLPTMQETKLLGNLQYDENYGVDEVHSLCPENFVQMAIQMGSDAFIESHLPGEIPWMEGVITQADGTYYIEKTLEQSLTGYERSIIKIVKKVLCNKPEQVVVAGAGEAGRKLQRYMELYGIRIEAFTDNNQKLQGSGINGIPVKSLKDSFVTKHYVIASFAYAEEIARQIRELKGNEAIIYQY